jgi:pimeloyl-ACP methyl ester carboxylesterase
MTGTVVFQHGLGGGADQVAQNWPEGTGLCRVTRPCRGHDSVPLGPDRPFTIPMFSQDVLAALVETDQFVAAGISMGAAIALYLACHHPDRVQALVLIRPAWTFTAAPDNMKPVVEMATLLRHLSPHDAAAAFRASNTGVLPAQDSPDNLSSLLGYADRDNATTFAEVLLDIASGHPGVIKAQVAALRLPCLIIGNDIDTIHPMACAETLAETIPHARLLRVTPKSVARDRHQAEIRAAVAAYLAEHSWSKL